MPRGASLDPRARYISHVVRALYLHVPFCPKICPYCDFHKMRRHEGLVAAYLDRLEEEARGLHTAYPGDLDTIYVGGGTPSHLEDAELERIFGVLDDTWGWPARVETTLEADPLTFDPERLERFRAWGVSRLSIGLQSVQDDVLRFLGRAHDGRAGLEAVRWALGAGFDVSADIITAVPGQDAAVDLHAVAATGVPHVSVYTLSVEPYTPFARRGVRVDPDREADDYALADEVLATYGYGRYEVSSHALPGHESRHNQVYWHGEPFLALGPSAAGYLPGNDGLGVRTRNAPIKTWLEGAPAEEDAITPRDYVLERLMTGLRTRRGVDLAAVARVSGIDPLEQFAEPITVARAREWLELDGSELRCTPAGLARLDAILREIFAVA